VLARNAEELLALLRPGDVVLIHHPQPAGLAQAVKRAGARAVWRSRPARGRPARAPDRCDAHDLPAFGAAVEQLLRDRQYAARLGANAHARAAEEFLGDRHLGQYGRLFANLTQRGR